MRRSISNRTKIFLLATMLLIAGVGFLCWHFFAAGVEKKPLRYASTIAGVNREFGEPFGVASKVNVTYVSDGESGKIFRIDAAGMVSVFAEGFDTPSALAFAPDGSLIVADSGTHTIKSVNVSGAVILIAGIENENGFADGDALNALFNAPIGIAVAGDGSVFVADTYNDRIRVIKDGRVATLAGGERGFADGLGEATKFDTPCAIVVWQNRLLIGDTGNRRLRVVELDGRVWTLAGNGEEFSKDGLLASASFPQPMGLAIADDGSIFVADGNAVRHIAASPIPVVRTMTEWRRGIRDGSLNRSQFNRPSGLAIDNKNRIIVADSENRLVRRIDFDDDGPKTTGDRIASLRDTPEQFRRAAPARWPYDPPNAKRDIAGTLGEIRGEVKLDSDEARFHNGLDIAGAYGETARFIRDEKVLSPHAADNFETLRELIRMPTLGYIHIRLGRYANGKLFDDPRFKFERDGNGKIITVRVPRGTKFRAGEPIGTLNAMNHIHLVAGRGGNEMNALEALVLPGLSDSRPPVTEKITLTDENWRAIETRNTNARIRLSGKTRVIVEAYDQMDGNSERRRLGVYNVRLGLRAESPVMHAVISEIKFDRMPPNEAVPFVYAPGSKSGPTGETIFRYIATNSLGYGVFREEFIDGSNLPVGNYTLSVVVKDYFGNVAERNILVEVVR